MKNKRANILTENIVFIILNLVFISILIIFLFARTGDAAVIEEKYAKEIALALDSARPGMSILINMDDAVKIAEKNNLPLENIVTIQGNIVTVKLRENGEYSYSFFNNINPNEKFYPQNKSEYFSIEQND